MIDETLLADPTRCPDCGTATDPRPRLCPRCALPLTGPVAGRLWRASVQAAEVLRTRAELLAELRLAPAAAPPSAGGTVTRAPTPAAPARRRAGGAPSPAGVVGPTDPEPAARAGRRAARRRGGDLRRRLLAPPRRRRPVGRHGRPHGARRRRGGPDPPAWPALHRRVALAAHRRSGAARLLRRRSADLAGLGSVDGAVFWAGALAAVAAGAAGLAVLLPTRVLPLTAALLGQLPLPLVAAHLVVDVSRPLALAATLLTVQAVVGLAAAATWPAGTRTDDARAVVGGGALLAYLAAALAAGAAAYGEQGSLVVGTALLLGLAAVAALAGTLLARGRPAGDERVAGCDVAAAVLLVAAAWAPLVDRWTTRGPGRRCPCRSCCCSRRCCCLPRARASPRWRPAAGRLVPCSPRSGRWARRSTGCSSPCGCRSRRGASRRTRPPPRPPGPTSSRSWRPVRHWSSALRCCARRCRERPHCGWRAPGARGGCAGSSPPRRPPRSRSSSPPSWCWRPRCSRPAPSSTSAAGCGRGGPRSGAAPSR